jgi:NAD(P)-dependent dehydrogenase (short-subunit alcohol dehydrogenase family)
VGGVRRRYSFPCRPFRLTRRGGAAATYGISKAALNALTSTLAADPADTPVFVNAVYPA